jgi:hypothetical protein
VGVRLNLASFKLVSNSPFVFESSSAVTKEFYQKILASFPTSEMRSNMSDRFFAEIESARHRKEFHSVIAKSKQWSSIYKEVTSPRFRRALLQHFGRELCEFRGVDQVRNLRVSDTEVKCSFHLSRNGYLLAPHTDTGLKLITIIIYLLGSEEELVGAGTRFYKARDDKAGEQYLRSLLDDEDRRELDAPFGIFGAGLERVYEVDNRTTEVLEEIKRFDMIHERILETPFVSNRSVIFIKSNDSWHDVRLDSLQDGQLRKSFVINFSAVPITKRNFMGRARRRLRSFLSN